jgi:hypothetical protein
VPKSTFPGKQFCAENHFTREKIVRRITLRKKCAENHFTRKKLRGKSFYAGEKCAENHFTREIRGKSFYAGKNVRKNDFFRAQLLRVRSQLDVHGRSHSPA